MWVLCEVESYFNEELDQSMCRVRKPLQVFTSQQEALNAESIFADFYDYNIRVVKSTKLHEEFR